MRSYPGMRLAPEMGLPQLKEELQKLDTWARLLSSGLGRVALAPQGSGPAGGNTGGTSLDLTQFWYLPGRLPEQRAYGKNLLQALQVSAGGSGTPTVTQNVGLFAPDQNKGIPNVWLGIEGTDQALVNAGHADRPYHANRYWAFPAFNQLATGETNGIHFFADQFDYQVLQNKTLSNWVLETQDASGIGIVDSVNRGETESGVTRAAVLLFHGSYPQITWKRTANGPSAGVYPAIAFPPLDTNAAVIAPAREKQHILCVMRKDHTDTSPFEEGGPLMGGGLGRELYPMFTSAQGTLTAPADLSIPLWHPSQTKSCDFVLGSASVTIASGTTGLYKGMRMRETSASYSLPEDVHIVSVDDATHITMSTTWPASNLTRTVIFFGMTWSDTALSVALDHGALTGLTDDDHPQYLLLAGRTGGQIIGSLAHTGGNPTDVVIEGRLLIGDNLSGANFASGTQIGLKGIATNNSIFINLDSYLGSLSGIASGTLDLLKIVSSGTAGYTSGSLIMNGLNFAPVFSLPAGVTFTRFSAINAVPAVGTGTGTYSEFNAFRGILNCSISNGTFSNIHVFEGSPSISNNATTLTTVLRAYKDSTTLYRAGALTQSSVVHVESGFLDISNNALWCGVTIPTITSPTQKWALNIADTPSRQQGKTAIGWFPTTNAAITALLHLGAGTTTLAPFMLTSGTSTTTPLAGSIEMTTDDLFFTITTGPARKGFVFNDGSNLTSSHIAYATTNGRLVGSSNMTFNGTTLTVNQVAATTFVGNITMFQKDIVTDTSVGMRLGGNSTQKVGFWGATPVVQPVTGGAAATFVANTSGIVDDSATFDGYSLGQVVKALRTIGILT